MEPGASAEIFDCAEIVQRFMSAQRYERFIGTLNPETEHAFGLTEALSALTDGRYETRRVVLGHSASCMICRSDAANTARAKGR